MSMVSRLGRWPTLAFGIIGGLFLIVMGMGVFLVTIGAWGGGYFLLPAAVLTYFLVVLGVALIVKAVRRTYQHRARRSPTETDAD